MANRVFDDLISSFAPLGPQTLFNSDNPFMGTPLDTGAKVLPNGDVHFGFYAPHADSVEVSSVEQWLRAKRSEGWAGLGFIHLLIFIRFPCFNDELIRFLS